MGLKYMEDFVIPTQKDLFKKLSAKYRKNAIVSKGEYILVPGNASVMLLAHLDTVHCEPVEIICESDDGNIMMSPQGIGGDDRCGVYALVSIYSCSTVKPWLLFTCDEEIGGIGALAFCDHYKKGRLPKELDSLKLLIEIDREGKNDAVYYDCANEELEDYISSKDFRTNFGSFSDISFIAPKLGVAAVNLSSGYYNAHTQHEYINRRELGTTIEKVIEIVEESSAPEFPRFEYIDIASDRFCGCCLDEDLDSLWDVPPELLPAYEILLDYYTVEELESIRAEEGSQAIEELADDVSDS